MKKILFLILFATLSFSANLLTYNIYERTDRVDIMLSFDSPYEGKIYQTNDKQTTTLKLEDLSFNKIIQKKINSKIIQYLTIQPNKNNLKIILQSKNSIGVIASKTADGFGLRIRATPIKTYSKELISPYSTNANNAQNLQTFKDSSLLDTRYVIVIIFLFALLLFMFWIKRKFAKRENLDIENSWLFKKGTARQQDIKILKKKMIDTNNSVVLVEFENKKYLIASGNSNVLLDTFGQTELEDSSEFEKAFEDNRKKLDDYLKLQDQKLNTYKDKASNEYTAYENRG
ncbi:MAG: flagellar biosynthetic protein FliO [Epsilonproteobacteria bacterium]|nr:flagellar biosynthetic protein FliO [Campylobacterota bacterium]